MLDFGCGWGDTSVRLARIGYLVEGFDISPANIAHARELAGRHGCADRCRFAVMSAEALEYADEAFDLIVGFDILHHVEIVPALAQCRRVLRSGGLAIFKEPVRVGLDAMLGWPVLRGLAPRARSFDPGHHVTDDERQARPSRPAVPAPNLSVRPSWCVSPCWPGWNAWPPWPARPSAAVSSGWITASCATSLCSAAWATPSWPSATSDPP